MTYIISAAEAELPGFNNGLGDSFRRGTKPLGMQVAHVFNKWIAKANSEQDYAGISSDVVLTSGRRVNMALMWSEVEGPVNRLPEKLGESTVYHLPIEVLNGTVMESREYLDDKFWEE